MKILRQSEPYKVKSSLRVYEALKLRARNVEGWDKVLALNLPYDKTTLKNIDDFNLFPKEIRKDYYKKFVNDNELLCEISNANGFELVHREDNETIKKLTVDIFKIWAERMEAHEVARLFKTTLEPFDLNRLSQFQWLFYKLLIRTEKEVNWNIPKAEKPTPEQTLAIQKAYKELNDYQKSTVQTCVYYDLMLWSENWNK